MNPSDVEKRLRAIMIARAEAELRKALAEAETAEMQRDAMRATIQAHMVRPASAKLERLREAVAALPERQREAGELVYFRGMNQREAATELGVTYTAVQHRLTNALRTLRGALAKKRAA